MSPPSTAARWLATCALLCAAMVVVGGITRLTGSGLSITEWRPITGVLPPLSHDAWERAFALYRESPQFRLVNAHFELADFQRIYRWEWTHRALGRVVGLTYLLPLLWLGLRRTLPRWLLARGAVLALLVGVQGLIGWLMVASGLRDEPAVSHLRLAAHLCTALFTFALTLFTWLEVRDGRRHAGARSAAPVWAFLALLAVQITWGAFVAGLRGGLVHNTWPLMKGALVPQGVFFGAPLLHDPAGVQLVHRWLAFVVVAGALALAWQLRARAEARVAARLVVLATAGQLGLGIVTLVHFHAAPVLLGTLHQFGAVVVLASAVALLHRAAERRDGTESARKEPA